MIYNNEKGLIISCHCGCGSSLNFFASDSVLYVDALESNFSTVQSKLKSRIQDKCKLMWKKFQNKPIYQHGIILMEDEFNEFIENLKRVTEILEEDEEDCLICKDEEKSAIHITKMTFPNDEFAYDIDLRVRLHTKNLLLNEHRAYETYFTKKEMKNFIKNIEKKF